MRTNINVTTMEGANAGGRQAVNGLLDAAGSSAPRCTLRNLLVPAEFTLAKDPGPAALPARAAQRVRHLQPVLALIGEGRRRPARPVDRSAAALVRWTAAMARPRTRA